MKKLIYSVMLCSTLVFACTSEAEHKCGTGPVKLTKQYTKEAPSKPENCLVGDTSIKQKNIYTLENVYVTNTNRDTIIYFNGSIMYDNNRVYTRECEQDYQYTDWPECGGERMFPLGLPRDAACEKPRGWCQDCCK